MKINVTMIESQETTFLYEQPNLKKYGTMKQLTEAFNGSSGDFLGRRKDDGIQLGDIGSANNDGVKLDSD